MRRSTASASSRIAGGGPPPMRLDPRRPSSPPAATQPHTVERPTTKRSATVSGLSPASTAASTRLRRSVEYAPAIHTSAHLYGDGGPNFLAVCSRFPPPGCRQCAGTGLGRHAAPAGGAAGTAHADGLRP